MGIYYLILWLLETFKDLDGGPRRMNSKCCTSPKNQREARRDQGHIRLRTVFFEIGNTFQMFLFLPSVCIHKHQFKFFTIAALV